MAYLFQNYLRIAGGKSKQYVKGITQRKRNCGLQLVVEHFIFFYLKSDSSTDMWSVPFLPYRILFYIRDGKEDTGHTYVYIIFLNIFK